MQVNVMKILQIGEYKEANYVIQRIGNAFQYFAFWEGKFYQAYHIINPEKGVKDFTHAQEVECAVVTLNFMQTTIDTLIATKMRDLKEMKEKKKSKKKLN